MGRKSRYKPRRLAGKLLQIRKTIDGGLTQEQMLVRLGLDKEFDRTWVSKWETGVIEPDLRVLLRYADIAGVYLDVLASDDLLLPQKLPCRPKSIGVRQARKGKDK